MRPLAELLPELAPSADILIGALTADSRRVTPGTLFAALPGARADGRAFVADAIARGAVAILAPTGTEPVPGAAMVTCDDPRRMLALAAARFHGRAPTTQVAATGTNGKSSVVGFTRELWRLAGRAAASIGTLGVVAPGRPVMPSLTTPDPVDLHRTLADLADAGIDHLAIEASSHGLDQRRLDGLTLAAGAFTNLSRDHLDYHGDMAAYLAAKARLFEALLPSGAAAVINADVDEAAGLVAVARARGLRPIRYGLAADADLRVRATTPTAHGQRLHLDLFGKPSVVEVPLIGAFQAMNLLTALGLAVGAGADADQMASLLSRLGPVTGRLERVGVTPLGATIYVDYAHTPDALATMLTAIRPHVGGRLVCVFGAGGDRDPGKRPLMGAAVARLADHGIVTDDNPRTEDPAAIRAAVRAGGDGKLVEIGDRAEAIARAIADLGPIDLLVVAGKGHEQGQTLADRTIPFDDATVVRQTLARLEARAA
jgi:UDP-N-acetylmuramoyl-L-alanyl-D-glutamate--2,6-diaminopimelate ligase